MADYYGLIAFGLEDVSKKQKTLKISALETDTKFGPFTLHYDDGTTEIIPAEHQMFFRNLDIGILSSVKDILGYFGSYADDQGNEIENLTYFRGHFTSGPYSKSTFFFEDIKNQKKVVFIEGSVLDCREISLGTQRQTIPSLTLAVAHGEVGNTIEFEKNHSIHKGKRKKAK